MEQIKFTPEQTHDYFVGLHKKIHWLLLYKEENFPALDNYFNYIFFILKGLQGVFQKDRRIVELVVLLEAAKIEASKEDYDHQLYRKSILDAHSIIDALEKEVANG